MHGSGIQIGIDRAESIGSGQCLAIAPRVFRFDDAMKAEVIDPDGETLETVLQAAEACPARAIYVSSGRDSLFP
jgi:ferredoxin